MNNRIDYEEKIWNCMFEKFPEFKDEILKEIIKLYVDKNILKILKNFLKCINFNAKNYCENDGILQIIKYYFKIEIILIIKKWYLNHVELRKQIIETVKDFFKENFIQNINIDDYYDNKVI